MNRQETLRALRQILARLYPTVDDARRIVTDAGLDPSYIRFDEKAVTNWHNILAEAENRSQLATLVERARQEFPRNQELLQAIQALEGSPAEAPGVEPTEAVAGQGSGLEPVVLRLLADEARRGRLALFVGSDLPRTLTGLPSAPELARALAARYGLAGSPPTAAEDFFAVAQQAAGRFRNDLIQFLREALDSTGQEPAPIDRLIARLPLRLFITTRYDNLLERAFQEIPRPVDLVTDDFNASQRRADRATLVMLFGDLRQPRSLTLIEDDLYDLATAKRGVVALVEQAFSSYTVLFLGFQPDNPGFLTLWREVLRRLGRDAPRAYALVDGPLPDDVRSLWQGRNIDILDAAPLPALQALATELT
ncbi:MAG: hypothetical protein KatS3mg050_2172 [Litorilinea sp.]|nr:MAG: hypothetical protein KatS3mg050_2172 [Litorilinea sp.]